MTDRDDLATTQEERDIGPRKRLRFELAISLPVNERYIYSYKTDGKITALTKGLNDSLIITGDSNGNVKFWKVFEDDTLKVVRSFKAHDTGVNQLLMNEEQTRLISIGKNDPKILIFELRTIDLVLSYTFSFTPSVSTSFSACFYKERVLFSEKGTNDLIALRMDDEEEFETTALPSIHRFPVEYIFYNSKDDFFITIDSKGIIEIWDSSTYKIPKCVTFQFKSSTDFFHLIKNKLKVYGAALSPSLNLFAVLVKHQIIIFDTILGLIIKTFSLAKEIDEAKTISFSKNGTHILLPDVGLNVLESDDGHTVSVYGKEDDLQLDNSMILNKINLKKRRALVSTEESGNQPLIILSSSKSPNLIVFGSRDSDFDSRNLNLSTKISGTSANTKVVYAVLHTTSGDIKIQLFGKLAPKTVENFVKLSQKNYYNNVTFHRVIKKFMIQTGDPLDDGTGGESFWGGHFDDEFNMLLTHSKPYMVSMANCGPNTNGSQFFITTEPATHLDNKHTIFGEVIDGIDVVKAISRSKTDKSDKPINRISILSVTLIENL